ncbi:MAG: hypothetical protein FJ011_18510 [Chloroflexi bacterium]|nr:hypothetical protein [Chloroflexota bacterium]
MTMINVALSEHAAEKLHRAAARRGTSISELLDQVVERYVADLAVWSDWNEGDQEDAELGEIEQEQRAYEARHSQLLEAYPGQYIAMLNGCVVDHDADRVALGRRIRTRYGNRSVLITPVRQEARQTIVIRRPRLIEEAA